MSKRKTASDDKEKRPRLGGLSCDRCVVCQDVAKFGKDHCKSCYGVLYKHIKSSLRQLIEEKVPLYEDDSYGGMLANYHDALAQLKYFNFRGCRTGREDCSDNQFSHSTPARLKCTRCRVKACISRLPVVAANLIRLLYRKLLSESSGQECIYGQHHTAVSYLQPMRQPLVLSTVSMCTSSSQIPPATSPTAHGLTAISLPVPLPTPTAQEKQQGQSQLLQSHQQRLSLESARVPEAQQHLQPSHPRIKMPMSFLQQQSRFSNSPKPHIPLVSFENKEESITSAPPFGKEICRSSSPKPNIPVASSGIHDIRKDLNLNKEKLQQQQVIRQTIDKTASQPHVSKKNLNYPHEYHDQSQREQQFLLVQQSNESGSHISGSFYDGTNVSSPLNLYSDSKSQYKMPSGLIESKTKENTDIQTSAMKSKAGIEQQHAQRKDFEEMATKENPIVSVPNSPYPQPKIEPQQNRIPYNFERSNAVQRDLNQPSRHKIHDDKSPFVMQDNTESIHQQSVQPIQSSSDQAPSLPQTSIDNGVMNKHDITSRQSEGYLPAYASAPLYHGANSGPRFIPLLLPDGRRVLAVVATVIPEGLIPQPILHNFSNMSAAYTHDRTQPITLVVGAPPDAFASETSHFTIPDATQINEAGTTPTSTSISSMEETQRHIVDDKEAFQNENRNEIQTSRKVAKEHNQYQVEANDKMAHETVVKRYYRQQHCGQYDGQDSRQPVKNMESSHQLHLGRPQMNPDNSPISSTTCDDNYQHPLLWLSPLRRPNNPASASLPLLRNEDTVEQERLRLPHHELESGFQKSSRNDQGYSHDSSKTFSSSHRDNLEVERRSSEHSFITSVNQPLLTQQQRQVECNRQWENNFDSFDVNQLNPREVMCDSELQQSKTCLDAFRAQKHQERKQDKQKQQVETEDKNREIVCFENDNQDCSDSFYKDRQQYERSPGEQQLVDYQYCKHDSGISEHARQIHQEETPGFVIADAHLHRPRQQRRLAIGEDSSQGVNLSPASDFSEHVIPVCCGAPHDYKGLHSFDTKSTFEATKQSNELFTSHRFFQQKDIGKTIERKADSGESQPSSGNPRACNIPQDINERCREGSEENILSKRYGSHPNLSTEYLERAQEEVAVSQSRSSSSLEPSTSTSIDMT
eukprot:gene2458-5392_t